MPIYIMPKIPISLYTPIPYVDYGKEKTKKDIRELGKHKNTKNNNKEIKILENKYGYENLWWSNKLFSW